MRQSQHGKKSNDTVLHLLPSISSNKKRDDDDDDDDDDHDDGNDNGILVDMSPLTIASTSSSRGIMPRDKLLRSMSSLSLRSVKTPPDSGGGGGGGGMQMTTPPKNTMIFKQQQQQQQQHPKMLHIRRNNKSRRGGSHNYFSFPFVTRCFFLIILIDIVWISKTIYHHDQDMVTQDVTDLIDTSYFSSSFENNISGIPEHDVFQMVKDRLEKHWKEETIPSEERSLLRGGKEKDILVPSSPVIVMEALRNYDTQEVQQQQQQQSNNSSTGIQMSNCRIPFPNETLPNEEHYSILAFVSDHFIIEPKNTTTSTKVITTDRRANKHNEKKMHHDNLMSYVHEELRNLVTNCLAWLLDHPNEITIVLPNTTMTLEALRHDHLFGTRLLSWHENKNHPVKLLFSDTIRNAIHEYYDESQRREKRRMTLLSTTSRSSGVLWIYGAELPWQGNRQGLKFGFESWKQQSAALVSTGAWQLKWNDDGSSSQQPNHTNNNNNMERQNILRIQRVGAASTALSATTTTTTTTNNNNNPHSGETLHTNYLPAMLSFSSPLFSQSIAKNTIAPTATFFHRQYFCLLQHPILDDIFSVQSDDDDDHDDVNWQHEFVHLTLWLSHIISTTTLVLFDGWMDVAQKITMDAKLQQQQQHNNNTSASTTIRSVVVKSNRLRRPRRPPASRPPTADHEGKTFEIKDENILNSFSMFGNQTPLSSLVKFDAGG